MVSNLWKFLMCLYMFICCLKCKTGDVELTNMQLKPEALNALKLPVKVKAGFLGSVKLKVCGALTGLIYDKINMDAYLGILFVKNLWDNYDWLGYMIWCLA